jgi:hypothetical protein
MVEDLGLYSGTKPKPSCYDFSLDLLYPRIVSEKIRHYTNRRYYKYLPNQNTTTYTSIIRILLLSGDISTNPGPVKYPCGKCSKPVKRNQRGIYCEDCTYWYHIKCIDLPIDEYQRLSTSSESWYCANCILPIFSNSFFNTEDVEDKSNAPTVTSGVNINKHTFKDLRDVRRSYPKNFMAAHLNINSLRYKFDEIKEVLTDNIVDLLIISETKLDESFNDNLFSVDGYKVQRRDRNQYGGGLLTFIRSDFPSSRKQSLESEKIETLCHEVYISDRKWLIAGAYKPPSMSNNEFTEHFSRFADRSLIHYEHMLLFGDLNFDMLNSDKSATLNDFCDIFNLSQLVNGPTCFKKGCIPSLVDVIMTNKKSLCFKSQNVPTGVSDCHNIISTVIKGEVLHEPKKLRYYRSYKTFDIENFNDDIEQIKINQTCHEVDSVYNEYEKDFINVLNKHAPIKSRYQRKKPLPCMNQELRRAVYRKQMLYSQFTKCQSNKNWEKFRKQRNFVTKLKRKSMKTYFLERCSGGTKSGDFWKTIKPFFSKKGSSGEQKIVLNESDKIVNDQKEVANHFNNFFSTVAENIGKDTVYDPSDHPSLIEIKKQNDCTNKFVFEKVTTDKVEKIINNINIKKATGADGIPAKIIKCSKSIIAPQITSILNMSIDQSVFPDKLKKAQVTPLYKKNDPLLKTNYRPVSVLCIFSKIFEKILEQQLSDFFENIFNPYLCAFRRGHGCQTTLLRLLEDWRNALEKNQYVAAVLMDLSKAFDCLPHDILLDKLSAYGMSTDSVSLLESYLSNRKQQIST